MMRVMTNDLKTAALAGDKTAMACWLREEADEVNDAIYRGLSDHIIRGELADVVGCVAFLARQHNAKPDVIDKVLALQEALSR